MRSQREAGPEGASSRACGKWWVRRSGRQVKGRRGALPVWPHRFAPLLNCGNTQPTETTHLKHWQSLVCTSGTGAETPQEVGLLQLLPLSTFLEAKGVIYPKPAEEDLGHYGTSEWLVALYLVASGGRRGHRVCLGVAKAGQRTGFQVAQAEALERCEGRQHRRLNLHPGAPSPIPTASLQLCGLRQARIPVIHMCHGLCAKAVILGKWPCPPLQEAAFVSHCHRHVSVLPPRGQHGKWGRAQQTREGCPAQAPSPSSLRDPATPTCTLPSQDLPCRTLPSQFHSLHLKPKGLKSKDVAEAWGFLLVQKILYTDPSMPSTAMQAPNNVQNKTQTLLYLQAEFFLNYSAQQKEKVQSQLYQVNLNIWKPVSPQEAF